MVDLVWEQWLPLEGCIKSEGREMTWFINPTVNEQWYLARAWRLGKIFDLIDIGTFHTREEAMESAQQLETDQRH